MRVGRIADPAGLVFPRATILETLNFRKLNCWFGCSDLAFRTFRGMHCVLAFLLIQLASFFRAPRFLHIQRFRGLFWMSAAQIELKCISDIRGTLCVLAVLLFQPASFFHAPRLVHVQCIRDLLWMSAAQMNKLMYFKPYVAYIACWPFC